MTDATLGERPVDSYEGSRYPAYRRRRRRAWPALLVIVLLLGAIVVVGDRVAAKYATDELRSQVVTELDNREVRYRTVSVEIGGFPFLTQVAQGNYEEISIEMTDVELPTGNSATAQVPTLPALSVVARGVNADTAEVVQGRAKVRADQVSGTAVVGFDTLASLVDYARYNLAEVRFAESGGRLEVTGSAMLGSVRIPISALADIAVVDGQFTLRLHDAKALDLPVPQAAQAFLADLVQRTIRAQLPPLPFQLTLDQVRVEPDGLAIAATGRDVPLVT